MTAPLLSLAALHAAASGVLDVVFGPDGDFEGAPFWAGPITEIGRYGAQGAYRWVSDIGRQVYTIDVIPNLDLEDAALDLRIPSIAARLAGLCARALDHDGPVYCYQSTDDGWWYLMPADDDIGALFWIEDADSEASFLAALTLALAPWIAALGGAR